MDSIAKVTSITIYPIKSCGRISVSQAALTPFGFRWDRNWLVVNAKGRAYTQKVEPKLALVEFELPNEAFLDEWEPSMTSYMIVKAPGMGELKISLMRPSEVVDGVSVRDWSGSALDEGAEAAKWFSDYLGKPSRLVRFHAASEARSVNPMYANGHNVLFANQTPFLLTSQESLDALNKLLNEPVPINRFRSNIVVTGYEPFSEDLWREIKINNFTFEGVRLCSRCKIVAIDQATGIEGTEPNETLTKFRSDKVLRPNAKQLGKIYFGQNLVWKDKCSDGMGNVIKVGDPVSVLKTLTSAEEAAVRNP